ncbi:hypothetical protein IB642_00615 [Allofrancisella guangzhouensis]|uniref:Uncharacterized protein n=1 Tax=Allofrancisella guangzhouensis TaxID=594679 RepID=A0A0A8E4N7_9GAMM|nr:hypothetical protein [Allofrancisella guangzhouensis]AJC48552.1 hypothetical protein SD28_02245 [Allofrancisella guangzhouensis]MBK2027783.1 hypothetical protein [Allofrancisella guangzhouensis]MBK2043521.1 hypothetical protein [Allofrancisella guangzhouensis]MBK2045776.1 hypothetical protein [Allofrancisella guangzhouensis]
MKKALLCAATILMMSSSLFASINIYDSYGKRTWSWSQIPSGDDINSSSVSQMLANWQNDSNPQIVVGLKNSAVKYYDGSKWTELHNDGWVDPVKQMSVNWTDAGNPKIVVGLGTRSFNLFNKDGGAIEYYNGLKWIELQGNGWKSPVEQMSVNWQGDGNPQIVVGLGNGAVEYYNGSKWTWLIDNSVLSAVTNMSVDWPWQGYGNPQIVVGLLNGSVYYYNSSEWTNLQNEYLGYAKIKGMSVYWAVDGHPKIVLGLDTGPVQYWDYSWEELLPATTHNDYIGKMLVEWKNGILSTILAATTDR